MREFTRTVLRVAVLAALLAPALLRAQDAPTITFDNQSGETALVKVVGPTHASVTVPAGGARTVEVAGGRFYILCRYGSAGQYRYTKGDSFVVTRTAERVSRIRITLHKVVNGNYGSRPISEGEFGQ